MNPQRQLPVLPLDITRRFATRAPIPKLELSCDITNPTHFSICILDAWTEVETIDGLKIDEGKLLKSMHTLAYPATIPPQDKRSGAFIIKLPFNVLHGIEERRAGGDLELRISSRVLVAKVSRPIWKSSGYLGVPYETSFGKGFESEVKYRIPQSEWVDLLRNLGWSETELIELPVRILRDNSALARALERFEAAQECFRSAQWKETMFNCRSAFEAAAREAGKTRQTNQAFKTLLEELIGKGHKADCINKTIDEVSSFLQLARHEDYPQVMIRRIDAQLALQLTGALLAYLGYAANG